jgi:hypothetical protein
VVLTLKKDDITKAFQRRLEGFGKCVRIGSDYAGKLENIFFCEVYCFLRKILKLFFTPEWRPHFLKLY